MKTNQDSPSPGSNDGNDKISATASGTLSNMSPDVQNLLSKTTISLGEECNKFLAYPSIEPLSTMFDADSTRLQQMNTGNISASTQQLSSSFNFEQSAQNLHKYDFSDTPPNESIESSQGVWWEQKCGRKAISCPNIYNANIFDSSSLSFNQQGTTSLLRNKSFSLPPIDKSTRIDESYAASISGVPQTKQFSNDAQANVEYRQRNTHEIDQHNIADNLTRNDFNFYKS